MKDVFDSPTISLALLVCDTVITDAATGKKTLVGIFNSVSAVSYPHCIREFYIFCSLTNCEPNTDISVRLTNSEGEQMFDLKGSIRSRSTDETPEVIFGIRNFVVKSEGKYELTLFANEIPIASRFINFTRMAVENNNG